MNASNTFFIIGAIAGVISFVSCLANIEVLQIITALICMTSMAASERWPRSKTKKQVK